MESDGRCGCSLAVCWGQQPAFCVRYVVDDDENRMDEGVSSRVSVLCAELWLATKDRRAVYNVARSED